MIGHGLAEVIPLAVSKMQYVFLCMHLPLDLTKYDVYLHIEQL